jgi:glycine/D-amino acid oxidase-like deaminating enzyme
VVRRKPLSWFAAAPEPHGPTWLYETPDGVYYGFPSLPDTGLKAACHSGGDVVTDALNVDRTLYPEDHAPVSRFMAEYRPPHARAPITRGAVCMYTLTPDEHFVVDHHPGSSRVVVVAGLSGHGFKLTSALGGIAAELALEGHTPSPVAFLSLARFRDASR